MKTLNRRDFISWAQKGYDVRAVALVEGDWFMEAMNCMRDGDMGEMGEDGVYSRTWVQDYVVEGEMGDYDIRPATPEEVDLYLKHCDYEFNGIGEESYIVRGKESYVLS